jgi:DNA polymerase III psi subunit
VQKQLKDIEQLLGKIDNQLKYSKMLIDTDQKLLNTGDLKVNDFLLAINNYRSIQFSQTQQQINRLLLINQLNYWGVN